MRRFTLVEGKEVAEREERKRGIEADGQAGPDQLKVAPGLDPEVVVARAVAAIGALRQADAQLSGGLAAALSSEDRKFLADLCMDRQSGDGALAACGLDQRSIRELVAERKHGEVCKRFAKAREAGVDCSGALVAYQRCVGAISAAEPPGWDKSTKRRFASLLNAVARAARSHLQVGLGRGLLVVNGSTTGTFYLRSREFGKTKLFLVGQGLGEAALTSDTGPWTTRSLPLSANSR